MILSDNNDDSEFIYCLKSIMCNTAQSVIAMHAEFIYCCKLIMCEIDAELLLSSLPFI